MRAGQQIGGQRVAAARAATLLRREVAGQAIAIKMGRQLVQDRLPLAAVLHADGTAAALFQAGVRVLREPVAHPRQTIGERGLQRDLHTATCHIAAGQTARRRGQRDFLAADLLQQALLHRQRHGWQQALADAQRIAGLAAGLVGSTDFPDDFLQRLASGLRRNAHLPAHVLRSFGWNVHGLRFQLQQRGLGRELDFHRLAGGVAQRDLGDVAIAFAHQRRQAADNLQILRGADAGFAGTEQVLAAGRHGHHAEAAQHIIQRHVDACFAVGIELDARVPQQQRVQQFAHMGAGTAVTAGRHGLAAIVAAANDFHLRGGGFHAPGTLLEHGTQQIPAVVVAQLQQGLVDCRHSHFGMGRRLAIGQQGADRYLGLLAWLEALLVCCHADLQRVGLQPDIQFGHAEAEGRLAQIDQRRGRHILLAIVPEGAPPLTRRLVAPGEEAVPGHITQAAAQCQHAHVDVGAPFGLDFQFHGRILAVELQHLAVQNAFALYREQGGGVAERHAHLQFGGVAGLVAALFGQHIHAVVVIAAPPDFSLFRHRDRAAGLRLAAFAVGGGHHQFDFAGLLQMGIAQQQAAAVALARADFAQILAAVLVVIGVEAAHQTLAAGGGGVGNRAYRQRHAGLRLAAGVQRQRLQLQVLVDRDPALGADARDHRCRPDALARLQRLERTVGIAVGGFQRQILRLGAGHQLGQVELRRAIGSQRQRHAVGQQARAAAVVVRIGAVVFGVVVKPVAVAAKAVLAVAGKMDPAIAHAGRDFNRQALGRAAVQIGQLHSHRQLLRGDQRGFRYRLDAAAHHRQTEFLDAEIAAVDLDVTAPGILAAHADAVHAKPGTPRDLPLRFGRHAAGGHLAPAQRLLDHAVTADMGQLERAGQGLHGIQALNRFDAGKVLHRYRFAGPQQAAVQHAVGAQIRVRIGAGGDVETPGFDAAVPVGPDKRHVGHTLGIGGACADEQRIVAAVLAAGRGFDRLRVLPQAVGIGGAAGQRLAIAAADGYLRLRHRLAAIQRGDPDQRAGTALLHVHAQIRDQGTGAHIHVALLEMRIEQRVAEQG